MNTSLEKIESFVTYLIVALVPVAILAVFPNAFTTPKLIVLSFGVFILILFKVAKVFVKGNIEFSVGSFDIPILLLVIAYLASAIVNTPNKPEAFFLPGTATIFTAGAFLYFLLNQASSSTRKNTMIALYISGIIVAVFSLFSTAGIFNGIGSLPAFMKETGFTPVGGSLPSFIMFVTLIPVGISYMLKEKDVSQKAFWGVSLALLLFGTVTSLINIVPGKSSSPQLPSFRTSWVVTVDTLKNSPLLGIGAGNYLTAFNRFRPIEYNQTDLWRLRFTSARNFYFTVITETGLLGFAALAIIAYSAYKTIKSEDKEKKLVGWSTKDTSIILPFVILAILMLLFPSNIVFVTMIFVFLALNSELHPIKLGALSAAQSEGSRTNNLGMKLPIIIVTLPVIIGFIVFSYYSSRAIAAEHAYKKSLDAIAKNDGRNAYDLLRNAINTNPYVDRYHTSYAQINLALANTIASKEDITDQDRETVAQLIQQAIREGKSTVTLNPQRAANWEVLGRIYQAIIPLAENANAFAAETYRQAVALDPINPELRIALGGIYYAAGDYNNAIRIFELAAATKPDFPNAYYNLAYALYGNEQYDQAIQQMSVVLSLVESDSQDYETARQALENFQEKKEATAPSTDNLTPPQEQEEPIIEPPIELPEEAEPPEQSASPSPAASPTPLP